MTDNKKIREPLLRITKRASIVWWKAWIIRAAAIIAGFVIGIISLVVLVKIEGRADEPLIPLNLFKNRNYSVLLIVGFICYF